jgi:LDH2 family malate/lactate/ureidoglycolate dehydrogenase
MTSGTTPLATPSESTRARYAAATLIDFTAQVLVHCGMTEEDARLSASVLVDADLMGVDSHGIAHLATHGSYVSGLRSGRINPRPQVRIVRESAATALVDGDGGFGPLVGYHAMQTAIRKAKEAGSGTVAVRNSRHFGAAGYYALMAARADLIGMAMTNSGPWMIPTFAKKRMIGTNPIAVAAPAGVEQPFLCDFATSTVAMGKVEIAERDGRPVPEGWGLDEEGRPTTDIDTIRHKGGLTPLGGTPSGSSYKGYALGMVVDLLCGILSGAGYSLIVSSSTGVGHFFAAWDIAAFRPLDEFKAMMDEMQRTFRTAEPVDGADRVLLPGQREFETRAEREKLGIPLHPRIVEDLERLAVECGLEPPRPV